jgi:hypothetical protein
VGTDGALSVIHHFEAIAAVASPTGRLLFGRDGKLYGQRHASAMLCWGPVCGVVYAMTEAGTVTVVHRFFRGQGALYEVADLGFAHPDGSIYGVTFGGAIFSLTPSGQFSIRLQSEYPTWYGPKSLTRTSAGTILFQATEADANHRVQRDIFFSLTPQGTAVRLHQLEDGPSGGLSFVDGDDGWVYGARVAPCCARALGSTFRIAVDAPTRPTGVRIVR